MRPKMLVVSTLFFNKTGNQSLLETMKRYTDNYDVLFLTSASKKDPYYYTDEEIIDFFSSKLKVIRVYQVIPNLLRAILKVIKSIKPNKTDVQKLTSELTNLHYNKLNIMSFNLASKIFYIQIKRICHWFKPDFICAYEIGAVKPVLKYKKMSKLNVKYFAKYQGTVLGFNYNNIDSDELYQKYSIDIDAYKLSSEFDLCAITNDGTNGTAVLKYFGVQENKIICLPNGISNNIIGIKDEIDISYKLDDRINLFTISRLVGWKRVYLAIEIMNRLVNELGQKKFKLNIYGHGNEIEVSYLNKLVSDYNLLDYVTIHGPVSFSKMKDVYNTNSIMLSLYRFTNLTNPVLEAIYLNKPVISLNDPNLEMVLNGVKTDRVELFEQDDEDIIITKVSDYLSESNFEYPRLTENFDISWDNRIKEEMDKLISVEGKEQCIS